MFASIAEITEQVKKILPSTKQGDSELGEFAEEVSMVNIDLL